MVIAARSQHSALCVRQLTVLLAILVGFLSVSIAVATPANSASPRAGAPTRVWSQSLALSNRTSSPVITDIDADGIPDVILGGQDGWLRVLDARTGAARPNWPQPARVKGIGPVAIDSSPTVADLDRSGTPEIIVGAGSTWVPNQPGGLVVFAANGAIRCSVQTFDFGNIWTEAPGPDGYSDGVFSTPAVGDVDGDGFPDIVFGGFDFHIWAVDRNCNPLPGFPYNVEDTTWSSPALYDVDDDGRQEIFIGSDQTAGGLIDWSGGEFRALDWSANGVRELWRNRINDVFSSSAAIGDINGDGRLEVVTGAGDFYHQSDRNRIFAWHIDDGSTVPGWPQTVGGVTSASPALVDLSGDGVVEVVSASRDGYVRAWRGNGTLFWSRPPIPNCCVGPGPINASPIAADVNGDGTQDIIIGNTWSLYILDGRNGTVLYGPLSAENSGSGGYSYEAAAAIADVAGVGRMLITVGFAANSQPTLIAAYTIASNGSLVWPMFRKTTTRIAAPASGGNPIAPGYCRRASNPAATPSTQSGSGYWMVARDGGIFTFGGAGFHGSTGAMRLNQPVVGMAATPTGNGYWLVASDGGIFTFGDARFKGSTGSMRLNQPVVGMAATPTGNGYWLVASDGGIFTFGDARFYGSTGAMRLNQPVIAMAATPTGNGYWLVASDGGIFTFGDARFYGSTGAMRLNQPIIAMTPKPAGDGYWLLGADGGIFAFQAGYYGSLPGLGPCSEMRAAGIAPSATGNGYWIITDDGGVFSMGDARFLGSFPGLVGDRRAIGVVARR